MRIGSRIIVGVAATGLTVGALVVGAGVAWADDFTYLGGLRNAGIYIHKDAEPFEIQTGHRLCGQLRKGVPPEDVAAQYPALSAPVYLSILRDNLCPDAPG